jgi:hypothetical protein
MGVLICRFELQPPKNKGGCNQVHRLQPQPPLRNLPVATPGCNNLQPNTTQVATNSYNHLALIKTVIIDVIRLDSIYRALLRWKFTIKIKISKNKRDITVQCCIMPVCTERHNTVQLVRTFTNLKLYYCSKQTSATKWRGSIKQTRGHKRSESSGEGRDSTRRAG